MNSSIYLRFTLALLSVSIPMWLAAHMPSGSAFATATLFNPWLILSTFTFLILLTFMARSLTRP